VVESAPTQNVVPTAYVNVPMNSWIVVVFASIYIQIYDIVVAVDEAVLKLTFAQKEDAANPVLK